MREDLLLAVYFVIWPCLEAGSGEIAFLGSTVEDLPSMILMTLPYVEGFTKIGLGS